MSPYRDLPDGGERYTLREFCQLLQRDFERADPDRVVPRDFRRDLSLWQRFWFNVASWALGTRWQAIAIWWTLLRLRAIVREQQDVSR